VPEGIGSPVADGKLVYAERLDRVSSTWASPIVDANGRLYFATSGVSYVIQTGDQFKLLATNDLGDPNHASAAAAGGRLFLVGTRNVYCVEVK
jgi:outer membrane protein assembly factor BamB